MTLDARAAAEVNKVFNREARHHHYKAEALVNEGKHLEAIAHSLLALTQLTLRHKEQT